MHAIFVYGILLFYLLFVVEADHCKYIHKALEPYENNECHALKEDFNNASCAYNCSNNPNVTYEIDIVNGTVTARFPLLGCNITRYSVELVTDEKVKNESMCSANLEMNEKHSIKEYNIKTCDSGDCTVKRCGQQGEVVFKYVFTGCYQLDIKVFHKTASRMGSRSCAVFIETNYTKFRIADAVPQMKYHYRQAENVCTLDVMYPQAISKTTIEFNFSENDSTVSWAEVSVKAGIESSSNSPPCIVFAEAEVVEPTCDISSEFKDVTCTFFNVSPGIYCIRVRIDDERCVHDTLWTKNSTACRWSSQLVMENNPPDMPQINVLSSYTIAIVCAILGMGLVVLIIVGLSLRRRARMQNMSQVESPEEIARPMISGVKVLLLYPRDCKDFMNVMESFRKVLEAQNVEIFDCYNCEDILSVDLHWLKKVMTYPKLCTIIVNTQCAYLQQQAILSGCNIKNYTVYKEPTFLDLMFVYGLKAMMEDISADSYLKNFVIGINGFSDDEKIISLPTSFRRYNVPEHLPKLFLDMNIAFIQESGHLYNSSEYIELQKNVRNLLNYKSTNPHYLDDILAL